jgi:hypothetical protein
MQKRLWFSLISFALISFALALSTLTGVAAAQSKPAAPAETGFTSNLQFGGTSDSDGQVYELDSSVGYTFTKHFGMDVGMPVYFVSASSSTTGSTSANGIGNPSLDLRWKFPHDTFNYGTVLSGSAPVGDSKQGLSTGRATFNWTNRFDRSFSQVTPFVEAGFSNTTSDTRLFHRPYTTLGDNVHLAGGAEVDVWKSISVGGSLYDILPFGNQTVFSRITGASGNGGTVSHKRNFENNQQTTGRADIARDNGFSTDLDFSPNAIIDVDLGYTRSMHYDLNAISFSIGVNVGHLAHRNASK